MLKNKYLLYKAQYMHLKYKQKDLEHNEVSLALKQAYKNIKTNLWGIKTDEPNVFSTYGIMYDDGLKKLIDTITIDETDVFVDFGSGMGNVCFYINMMTKAKTIGIEFIEKRHKVALQMKDYLKLENVEFLNDNFVNFNNNNTTIIFTNSIMFDDNTINIIQQKAIECPSIRYLVSSKKIEKIRNFYLLKTTKCPASWGMSQLYIYAKC